MIIACDIDGTLFNNEHRAEFIPQDKSHADNWRRFNDLHIYDEPIQYRIKFLRLLAMMPGVRIVYITGRSDEFRDETIARLNLVQAPNGNLYMRQSDDHRKAADVKVDIIRRAIGHDGFALIDDDASVCDAVAKAFPNANVIKVPSQDCSYLAQAMEVV